MRNDMTYEERIKSMGLKPFEKYGFLYHADVSNRQRQEALNFINQFKPITSYKVSEKKSIKFMNSFGEEEDWVEPLLILAEDCENYYVFNGGHTYSFNKTQYPAYEIYENDYDWSKEDGFISK